MIKYLCKTVRLFLFISALCFLNSALVEAAIVRIDQAKLRLIIAPTEAKSGEIKVENPSNEPLAIKAYLGDWRYLPAADGSKEFRTAGATELSCAPWISFAPAEFTIPPFGQQVVRYTVKVPADAKGGHFAVLFFETNIEQAPDKETVGLMVQIRLGALFYVEAKDTVNRIARLTNFSVTRDPKNKNLLITGDFKNVGNVDITCGGSFHMVDKAGMVFARGEFNNVYTLPGDTAKLTAVWKEPLVKGKYDLVITLDLGKALEEVGMGRGPVAVKEAELEIGVNGEVVSVGELR